MKRVPAMSCIIAAFASVALLVLIATAQHGLWPARAAARAHPQGTLLVTNNQDSGPGSLRWAMLAAQLGDAITFDPAAFPPTAPVTISVASELPHIHASNLTVDARDAGVIIDGSSLHEGVFTSGIQVVECVSVTVQGLQMSGFPGAGIVLAQSTDCVVRDNVLTDNELGIGTWDEGAARNLITRNEAYGNSIGISISGGAHDIAVAENEVYQNHEFGVSVVNEGSSAAIRRNSIYDNGQLGIHLDGSDNEEVVRPHFLGFDLARGQVEGVTCPGCIVEVFSDAADEGAVFEGSTTADGTGYFTMTTRSPITGPHLTATATEGHVTSGFSEPTEGTGRRCVLQAGNAHPKSLIETHRAATLSDNKVGSMISLADSIGSPQAAEDYLTATDQIGFKWVRLSLDCFDWSEVAEGVCGYSSTDVDPVHDQLITDLAARGTTILYGLVFWDAEIEDPGTTGYSRFKTQAEVDRYLDYARFIARHFQGRVGYYEILNETFFGEDSDFTQQNIALEDYVNLVHEVLPVIKEEDPEAKVVAGPAPGLYDQACYDYQLGIVSSDLIMQEVDAVSWHPGPYPVKLGGPVTHLYEVPETIEEIRSLAGAHGFTGEYIPEEIQWPTDYNPSESEPWNVYSETISAKYYGRGILDHRGLGMPALLAGTATEGNLPKMDVIRNLGTLLAGADPAPLPLQVASTLTDVVSYTFAYQGNGGYLAALWQGGFASNEIEPGTPLTLTLSGLKATQHLSHGGGWSVTGYDVLHSFRQRLDAYEDGRSLVIPHLLVQDYPLVLRMDPTKRVFLPVVLKRPE